MTESPDAFPDLAYLLDVFSETIPDRELRHAMRALAKLGDAPDLRLDETDDGLRGSLTLTPGVTVTVTGRRLPDDATVADSFRIVFCWPDALIVETHGWFELWTTEASYAIENVAITLAGGSAEWRPGDGWAIRTRSDDVADTLRRMTDALSRLAEMFQPGGRGTSWPSTDDFLEEMRAIGRYILATRRRRPRSWLNAVLDVYDHHASIPGRVTLSRASRRTLQTYAHLAGHTRFDALMDTLLPRDDV